MTIQIFSKDALQQENQLHAIAQLMAPSMRVRIEAFNLEENPEMIEKWGVNTFPTYVIPHKAWLVDPSIAELEALLPRLRYLALLFGRLVYQPCMQMHEDGAEFLCANEDYERVMPIILQSVAEPPELGEGMCINAVEFNDDSDDAPCMCPSYKKPIKLDGTLVTRKEYIEAWEKMALLDYDDWCSECLQKLLLEIRREKNESS